MRRDPESRIHEPVGSAPTMIEGPQREELRLAAAALDAAEQHSRPLEMCAALSTLARAYQALRAVSAAEESLRQAQRWAYCSGSVDLQVEIACELGEAACLVAETCAESNPPSSRAAHERARDAAFEVSNLVRRVADPQWEANALLRASDVLNRCGDHEDAAWLQGRALQLMPGLPSGER